MIGYLQGKILAKSDNRLTVGVGAPQHGSVGYVVAVAAADLYTVGSAIELFIHTHVREDSLDLFGFSSMTEKSLFQTLISVNGIGPKVAIGILSAAKTDQLIQIITDGNKAALQQLPGIGKKMAERLILELQDQVRKKIQDGTFEIVGSVLGGSIERDQSIPSAIVETQMILKQAKEALFALGFKEGQIAAFLDMKWQEQRKNQDSSNYKVEEIVREALQHLN